MPEKTLISRNSITRDQLAGNRSIPAVYNFNGLWFGNDEPKDITEYDIQKEGTLYIHRPSDNIWTYGQSHYTEESISDTRIYNNADCEIFSTVASGTWTTDGVSLAYGSLDISAGDYITIEHLTGLGVDTYNGYYKVSAVVGLNIEVDVLVSGHPTSGNIDYYTLKLYDVGLDSGSFAVQDSWTQVTTDPSSNIPEVNLSYAGSWYAWKVSDLSTEFSNVFTSCEVWVAAATVPEWSDIRLETSRNGIDWELLSTLDGISLETFTEYSFEGVLLADRKYSYFRVINNMQENPAPPWGLKVRIKSLQHAYLPSTDCWRLLSGKWSTTDSIKPMENYILADTYPISYEAEIPNEYTTAPAVYPIIESLTGAPYDGIYNVDLYVELDEVYELLGAPDPGSPRETSSAQVLEVYSYDFDSSSWAWKTLDTSAISGGGITPVQWWNKSLQGSTEIGLYSATDSATDRKIFFRITSIYGSNVWKLLTGGNYTLTYKSALTSNFVSGS